MRRRPGALCTSAGQGIELTPLALVPLDPNVGPPLDPNALTAEFRNVPDGHNGRSFLIEIWFSHGVFDGSETFNVKKKVREALVITNGRAPGANLLTPATFKKWRVKIETDGNAPVTVRLDPPSGECTAETPTCTPDGRKLAESIETTVQGPPGLSIADARVEEGPGAQLEFEVTIDRAVAWDVQVDYATSNDTATAGEDYTARSGRLTINAGSTRRVIPVTVLDDAHDEGEETMTMTLSNPWGAYISDAEATGTIENSDLMPAAWLSRFGRTVGEQVVDAARGRLAQVPATGVDVNVAGFALGKGIEPGLDDARAGEETWPGWDVWRDTGSEREPEVRTITGHDLLIGSSLSLAADASDGAVAGLWARGVHSSFSGEEGELSIEGEVSSAMVGVDWSSDRWSAGALVAHSTGEGSYRGADAGKVESDITGVYPYARRVLTDRVTLWGVAGYGEGRLTLTPDGHDPLETDMDLAMAAAGARGVLIPAGEGGGPELAAVTDAMGVRTASEAVRASAEGGGNMAAADTHVTRLRLGLEGTWPGLTLGSGTLAPRLEIALRQDGGDAETGAGVDIGGALAWADPTLGLRAEAQGRGLLTHEADGLGDRGFAGSVSFDPRPESDRGLSLRLTQSLGGPAAGGMEALFGRDTMAGLSEAEDSDDTLARRLELNLGYGLPAFGNRFTATPELGLGFSDTERRYRLGWRLGLARPGPMSLDVTLEATRRERSGGEAAPEHGIGFGLSGRW